MFDLPWLASLAKIFALILPVPGLIAFYWSWKDRKEKQISSQPYAIWCISETPIAGEWYPSDISIKNRWDEPLYGRMVSVKGLRGAKLFHPGSSPVSDVDFSEEVGSRSIEVDWTFWTSSRTGDLPSSGGTVLYIKLPGRAQSGIKPFSKYGRLSRLRLEIALISASTRKARCIAKHKWMQIQNMPMTKRVHRS